LVALAASAQGAARSKRSAEVDEGTGTCTAAIHKERQDSVNSQDSPLDSDLEVPPKQMSRSCMNIFAPLQSIDINKKREQCKCKYDQDDAESIACKVRCILENTGFVHPETGKVMVAPFTNVINGVLKNDTSASTQSMAPRIIAAFNWCHDNAKTHNSGLTKENCGNPVYTKYGICLWEMVNKLCLGVNNKFSNTDEPWGLKPAGR